MWFNVICFEMLLNGLICNKIRNKKKSEKSFAGIWLAHVLALFLNENPLSLIISSHFPLSPSSPARTGGSHPQEPPACPVREPGPSTLAIVAGLRAQKLTNAAVLTLARGEPRLNSGKLGSRNSDYVQSSQKPRPRFALKKTHIMPVRKRGGGGASRGALFSYNSLHPPAIFSPISRLTSPHLA